MATKQKVKTRRHELESLFKRFPDVPREVVVKEDILRYGQAFGEAALKVGEQYRTKTYGGWLFSFDRVTPDQAKQGEVFRVPDYLELKGGLYNLRGRLRVRCRVNPDSPYVVDQIDGKLWVCERDNGGLAPIAELWEYRPIPRYWSMKLEDGTPYNQIIRDDFATVFMFCQHWGPDEECRFCDINENARMSKERGALTIARPFKTVEQIATVAEEIFVRQWEERPEYDRPKNMTISGGAITNKLDGLPENEFYIRYIRAIREKIGSRFHLNLQSGPKSKEDIKVFKDAGLDSHSTNLEVWDKDLFPIICPGKQRVIGREEWIRRMVGEVDVMGEGGVTPGFVVGCEMAKPFGFKTVDEAVKSYEEGFEFLMSHGVVPRPISWCVEPRSALADQEPPPTEYFIRIDRAWYERWLKHRLPPPSAYKIGPGVSEYPNNAAADMGYP